MPKTSLFLLCALLPLTAPAAQRECLGRISFTIPQGFEWALATSHVPMSDSAGFYFNKNRVPDMGGHKGLYPYGNTWNYSTNLSLMTTNLIPEDAFNNQWRSYAASASETIMQRDLVKTRKRGVKELVEGQLEQKAMLARGEEISVYKLISDQDILDYKKRLQEAEEKLQEMENPQIPIVPLEGLAGKAYTINYDVQRAFIRAKGRDYMFYLSNRGNSKWGFTEADTTVDEVKALLTHFIPRQLGEIPKQTGFCYPYGYLTDDGNTDYEIKNSFRFANSPNTVYSLYTGNNQRIGENKGALYGALDGIRYKPEQYESTTVRKTIKLNNGATLSIRGIVLIDKLNPKDPDHRYHAVGEVTGLFPNDMPYLAVQLTGYKPNPEGGRPQKPQSFDKALKQLVSLLNSIKPIE